MGCDDILYMTGASIFENSKECIAYAVNFGKNAPF